MYTVPVVDIVQIPMPMDRSLYSPFTDILYCNKVGNKGGGIINFFIIATPIDFCYYSHACSCSINMTLLYHFMLYCIALCNTGVLMPYQYLYDLSCMILLYQCIIVCILGFGSTSSGHLTNLATNHRHQGGLAHLPIGIAWPLCTSGAFPILFLPTEVTTDNCPFTFPLPTLPPPPWQSSPLPPALCPLPAN